MKLNLIGFSFWLLILNLCILGVSYSQQERTFEKLTINSPNATAINKYVDIPVNLHTGIPGISIPIYSFNEGPINFSISLDYQSGGIRVEEMASWVGLGWTLNAGGVITRTVKGTPDERGVAEYGRNSNKTHLTDGGYNKWIFAQDNNSNLTTNDVFFINDINEGFSDGEPDLFTFNFCGYSGKFYFDDDGYPRLIDEADIKIEYDYVVMESIRRFIITTNDGTKYYFGRTPIAGDVDAVEITHNYHIGDSDHLLYTGTNNTINAWYLYKIESADKAYSINLEYQKEEYNYKSVINRNFTNQDYDLQLKVHAKFYEHWLNGVKLSRVISNGIIIDFLPGIIREDVSGTAAAGNLNDYQNITTRSLGLISISNDNGVLKKFILNHSHFNSSDLGLPQGTNGLSFIDRKRLKLESVIEQSSAGINLPPTVFEYFAENLPRRLSFAKDHWGYNNGKTTNTSLIPTIYEMNGAIEEIKYNGANRESSWPDIRANSLQKITYPTGGYVEFEFEPNMVWLSYPNFQKQIIDNFSMGFDGGTLPVMRTFQTSSSGSFSFQLSNSVVGGTATLTLPDGTSITASPGQTVVKDINLNSGIWQLQLLKQSPSTGQGASVTISQWASIIQEGNFIVGGMRVKKIKTHDNLNNQHAKEQNFEYNENNGRSSGHLYSRPVYVEHIRNDFLRDAGKYQPSNPGTYHCSSLGFISCNSSILSYHISGNTIRPMQNTQGNHIGYNFVRVRESNNGYKELRYYGSNIWDDVYTSPAVNRIKKNYIGDAIPSFPFLPPPHEPKRGKLSSEFVYSQSNILIAKKLFQYDFQTNILTTPALIVQNSFNFNGLPGFYDIKTYKLIKSTIYDYSYDLSGIEFYQKQEQYFASNFHAQLTRSVLTDSKGKVVENNYLYVNDLLPVSCNSISADVNQYLLNCNSCLTQYGIDRALTGHNTAFYQWWDYQRYLKCLSVYRISLIGDRKAFKDLSSPWSIYSCINNQFNSASPSLKAIMNLYVNNNNQLVESTQKNGNLFVSGSHVGFSNPVSLDGVVYPNSFYRLDLQSPSSIFTIANSSNGNLNFDSRFRLDRSIVKDNGVLKEILGSDGIFTSYIWNIDRSHPLVEVVGLSNLELSNALSIANNNIQNLVGVINSIYAKPFSIQRYNYVKGLGLVELIENNGRSIFYDYDSFNRLRHVKDSYGNIIKKYCYNYAGQPISCNTHIFLSAAYSANFSKSSCGVGFTGSTVPFSTPQGMFTSIISQADANQQAVNYVNQNGQANANTYGSCIPVVQPGPCEFQPDNSIEIPSYSFYCDGIATSGYMYIYLPNGLHPGNTIVLGAFDSGSCTPHSDKTETFFSGGNVFIVNFYSSGVIDIRLEYSYQSMPAGSSIILSDIFYNL